MAAIQEARHDAVFQRDPMQDARTCEVSSRHTGLERQKRRAARLEIEVRVFPRQELESCFVARTQALDLQAHTQYLRRLENKTLSNARKGLFDHELPSLREAIRESDDD